MNSKPKYKLALLLSGLLATQVLAQPLKKTNAQTTPWSISASLGMSYFQHMEDLQGLTALGRLSFDYALTNLFGLEMGIQNGNQMRFTIPKDTVDRLGGVAISGTLKPMLDTLFTLKAPLSTTAFNTILKGGLTYRQLQMDRESLNDIVRFSPQIQAGFDYGINNRLHLTAFYQYIFGNDSQLQANPLTETGSIANIPSQEAVLLGITLLL